jgi:uncharacterized membrane protein
VDKRSIYVGNFENLFTMFMSTVSIGLAIYALYFAEGKPMNTLVSALVCGLIAILLLIYVIYFLIKMSKLPKEVQRRELPDIKNITNQMEELKKLQTDLNDFFEHLPQRGTTQKK